MKKRYYRESVGECVSQVYEIDADNWENAKKEAFENMDEGDCIAECPSSAIQQNESYPDYSYINKDECTEYAMLCKGTWATRQPSGKEYWESRVWYFDDEPELFFNGNGEEFNNWEHDEED